MVNIVGSVQALYCQKELKNEAKTMIEENGLTIDYIEIADTKNLLPVNEWDKKKKLIEPKRPDLPFKRCENCCQMLFVD